MELFKHAAAQDTSGKPFAELVRPQTLNEYFGQQKAVGQGRILREAIENDRVPSLVLWGPPGTGKTTLARIIAKRTDRHFEPFSAVLGGVKMVRELVGQARERRAMYRRGTILFIDEIHRFNKGQQDALLPHVEDGTIVLIGATTENPSFELNAALLSRARVIVLERIAPAAMRSVLDQAMAHAARKSRWPEATITNEALDYLSHMADGDARRALTAMEVSFDRQLAVDTEIVSEALNRKLLAYDKSGDAHYQVVSAFIKSMRGSDPDATAYWLQRMVEAGEQPLFILRRMVVFASEDVGLADPNALPLTMAAVDAFRFLGMPEAMFTLMQAATYLACAPKSNTMLTALAQARRVVKGAGNLPVPNHLIKAASALGKQQGHGHGYKYPHDFAGQFAVQNYLPDALSGVRIFSPDGGGEEAAIRARLERWRQSGRASKKNPTS